MTTTTSDSSAANAAATAKDEAGQVASTATDAAGAVATTAKEQAGQVAGEAVHQAHNLLSQATDELTSQAGDQTQRLATNLRELGEELESMAASGDSGSTAHSVVAGAADRVRSAASYLDGKQPGELVDDLQQLGRRRPGMFLLGAALAGAAVGRLASAAKKASTPDATPSAPTTPAVADPAPPVRNSTPGAATIEPYPGATGSPTTAGML